MKKRYSIYHNGYITLLAIVLMGVFILTISGLMGFIFTLNRLGVAKETQEVALQIAEAGLDYYRWFLSHYPNDLQDGTGSPGPYVHVYNDPEGGAMGEFSLQITGNTACGVLSSIDISSTGTSYENTNFEKTISGRYARPSVGEFSAIFNTNVWFGVGEDTVGPVHSNGGIRMDGENQSIVTSAQTDWLCTFSMGCNPDQTQPGVFGVGGGNALWQFPVELIDFTGIAGDLVQLRDSAIASGLYWGPSTGFGYHVRFLNNGTLDIYQVDNIASVWGWHIDTQSWQLDPYIIASETFLGNVAIPVACSVIFVEDMLWVEGEIDGKVTIASGDMNPVDATDIVISGDIAYTNLDGSVGLTVLAERSIFIPSDSPDQLELRGIFIAQQGYFGRNYYPGNIRNRFELIGTIMSKLLFTVAWVDSSLNVVSGYENTEISFDKSLAFAPPPLTPFSDDEYRFIEWRQDK